MKIPLPGFRHFVIAFGAFFLGPQLLAETVFSGTALHDILILASGGPIFGIGTAFGSGSRLFWPVTLLSAIVWFWAVSLAIGKLTAKSAVKIGRVPTSSLLVFILGACVFSGLAPRQEVQGTIRDAVLPKLKAGMDLSSARKAIPRAWRFGMYRGMSVKSNVIQEVEAMSGNFSEGKNWTLARRELSARRRAPDGQEEYAYLYFDDADKLLFWFHGPMSQSLFHSGGNGP